jgi:hypothetical protein
MYILLDRQLGLEILNGRHGIESPDFKGVEE